MKTKSQWLLYQELELISESEVETLQHQSPFHLWLSKCWHELIDIIARKPEPKVWQSVDRRGNIWWNVYHPVTGESAILESEQEVRIWLEQSYWR